MKRIAGVILIVVSAAVLMSLGIPSAGAAVPTITSFSPTSGPVGCVVVITGTGFTDAPVSDVTFNTTSATDFTTISPTELSATVPPGATSGPIHVTAVTGTASSATDFTVTSGGECGGPGPSPGGSPIEVFTSTEPEICADVDTFGTAPILPTEVSVAATSNLLVYFSSEWSGLEPDTELLLSFRVRDAAGNDVLSTPFEWGVSNNPRLHDSGTVMWSFDGVQPGVYVVLGDARTDPVPGPRGGGNTNNNPAATLENCALTVFVSPAPPA